MPRKTILIQGFFRKTKRTRHETDIPAFGRQAEAHPRLSGADENGWRPQGVAGASRQGSRETGRLISRILPSRCFPSFQPPISFDRSLELAHSQHAARFPKSARIRDSRAFLRLLQRRKQIDGWLEMSALHTGAASARIGIIVSNRFLPRAVDRNAFKRTVREVFRRRRAELGGYDVLVRLRGSLKRESRSAWRTSVAASAARLIAAIGQ